jgi:hypothetical protein
MRHAWTHVTYPLEGVAVGGHEACREVDDGALLGVGRGRHQEL